MRSRLYSTPPYMRCRLIFEGIIFAVPHYCRPYTIFSLKKYFYLLTCGGDENATCGCFQNYAFKLSHMNINIDSCQQATCVWIVTKHFAGTKIIALGCGTEYITIGNVWRALRAQKAPTEQSTLEYWIKQESWCTGKHTDMQIRNYLCVLGIGWFVRGGRGFDLSNPQPVYFTIICGDLPMRQNLHMHADVRVGIRRNI